MIHNYEDFCKYYDEGKVFADIESNLGLKSVIYLRQNGWEISDAVFSKSKTQKDLLNICRKSAENFELAYRHAGIDFWKKED